MGFQQHSQRETAACHAASRQKRYATGKSWNNEFTTSDTGLTAQGGQAFIQEAAQQKLPFYTLDISPLLANHYCHGKSLMTQKISFLLQTFQSVCRRWLSKGRELSDLGPRKKETEVKTTCFRKQC